MPYFLGIDGGNSKTLVMLADETGRFISLGRGGNCNHQAAGGVERAMGCIAEAVEEACRAGGITSAEVTHACFCLAGADLPSDYVLLDKAITERWPGLPYTLRNDSFAGLRAGAPKGWGVVSISGSGTNQAGISPDGRAIQVGGLGGIWGDYGGGADLGRAAITAVITAADRRGSATRLTGPVLSAMGVQTVGELSEGLYHRTVSLQFYKLAPLVFAAADEGDGPAQEILIEMGRRMGESVCGVIRQLGMEREPVDVVLAGSTWKGTNPLMIDSFRLALHRVAPRACLVRPKYEPAVGAWCLAVEGAGGRVQDSIYQVLDETLPPELPVQV